MRPFRRLLHSLFLPSSIQSRERARWCGVDRLPSGTYNDCFLRHRADGDFVRNPEYLWSPGPYWAARGGFDQHIRRLADQLGGAVYSDALLVLHPEDHARTRASLLRSWETAAANELADCWLRLVESEGWALVMPGRSFHLRVLADGDPALGTIGLEPGEFATGLFPNLHLGPDEHAVPLVEVFVADERGRFDSVGTLWSDQLAFSLGAHPLDNASPPGLDDSAIYTVHRLPGQDGLHHRLGAGVADRLMLRTGSARGGDTVQLVDVRRDKVVLEVMLVAARDLAAELPQKGRPVDSPNVALPAFAPLPAEPLGTMIPEGLDPATIGAFSIIPEALPDRLFRLVERGALVQKVHFSDVMRGYRLEIDRDGRVGPKVSRPVATVEVLEDRPSIVALERDVSFDGEPLPVGDRRPLDGDHTLTWRGGAIEWRSVRRVQDRSWPYLGCLTTPVRSTPLPAGDAYTVGRDGRSCDVPLPDRSVAENIEWRDAGTGPVRIQGGSVERRTFRTDAICVATRAAKIDLSAGPILENLSATCPVHVLRADGEVVRLRKEATAELRAGDELCIGNALFSLVAPEADVPPLHLGVRPSTPAPAPRRRAAVLAEQARRPSAGGRPAPVPTERTVGALLGAPGANRPPVTQIGPTAPVPTAAVHATPVPTDQLPSLQLDPTTVALSDSTPTILQHDVSREVLADLRAPFAAEDAPVEDVPELTGLLLQGTPRGLRIETRHDDEPPRVIPPPGSLRRRPPRGLPGFAPVPTAPEMPLLNELPSFQGD